MSTIAAASANLTPTGPAAPQPRLVHAAHEFEAQMMQELLKPMTRSDALTGDGDDGDEGSAGALGQYAAEALGQALSEQGGFGIASSIIRQLTPQSSPANSHPGNNSQSMPVTGKPAR